MKLLKHYIKSLLREFQSMTPILGPTSSPTSNNLYFGPSNMLTILPGTEHLPEDLPKAACCFIQRQDGKILGVSRKDAPVAFGLPGGKVDPGEDFETAAKRELQEETGLIAVALKPAFQQVDASDYDTMTFVCDVENIDDIHTSEEGRVKWITWNDLLNGPFATYNKGLRDALGQ